ncbi:MAG: alpha/beta hydrolase [Hyphomonadaceae bacterium]|nr:alpha/beta hydrolase [Hyphomonadaceae bacterium]GIK47628.1 MAG: alpha/beta hydrolase [Alphaproteobacteria bacterium]
MTEAKDFRRVTFDVPGGRMAGVAFGAATPNPDIVFSHATGFNALTYRTLLAPLGEKFHVLALDARGHGRTELPAKTWGYTSWTRHRDDLIAVLEHFTAPVMLAGHSMGATVSLLTAGKRTDLVSGLALLEPVILPAALYALSQLPFGPYLQRRSTPLARGALKRRNAFASKDEAVAALTGRGVFKTFPPDVIADYVEDGVVENGKGGFKLACAPKFEAATYCAQRHDPWGALRKVTDPLVLLRAEKHSTIGEAAMHRIAAIKADARVATVEGASHMLPMERPDRARTAIETALLLARAGRKYHDAVLE